MTSRSPLQNPMPLPVRKAAVLLEVGTLYVLIQAYIWQWQYTRSRMVWPLFALILLTHAWHRETPGQIGFRLDNLLPALRMCGLAALPFLLGLLLLGTLSGSVWQVSLGWDLCRRLGRYIVWATFQQYGLQGYFHRRLRSVISNPFWSSLACGLVFMSLHFPNPILMLVTLLGGFALSWVYARFPNLLVLGLFHGLMGLLLSSSLSREVLHNMRVGPGYYR